MFLNTFYGASTVESSLAHCCRSQVWVPWKVCQYCPSQSCSTWSHHRAPVPAVSGQMTAPETPTDTAVLQRLFQGVCKKGAGFSAAKLMGSTASYTLQRASYILLLEAETPVMHKPKKSLKMKEPSPMIISKNKAKNETSFPGKKTWKYSL